MVDKGFKITLSLLIDIFLLVTLLVVFMFKSSMPVNIGVRSCNIGVRS